MIFIYAKIQKENYMESVFSFIYKDCMVICGGIYVMCFVSILKLDDYYRQTNKYPS